MLMIFQAGPPIPGVGPEQAFVDAAGTQNLSFPFFLVAFALWGISVLLMHQGVSFQRWTTKGDENAPDPESGLSAAWIVSGVVLSLWFLRQVILFAMSPSPQNHYMEFVLMIISPTRDLSLALLVASVPPGVVALVKFSLAGSLTRGAGVESPGISGSPVAAFVAGSFALIQLIASILTIILFLGR